MLVMVRLVRESSEEAWFAEMFGEPGARIVAQLKVEEDDISRIGAKYLTESQLAELRDATDRWRHDHPNQRYVAMASISDFPEAAARRSANQSAGGPGSVFGLLFLDPLSGLNPAVREVERSRESAERMFFYMQRMPLLLSWGAEAASRRMLAGPQVQQFVDSSKTFADSVQQFPKFLAEERERSVQQLARAVTEERTAAIKQLSEAVAVERKASIQQSSDAIAAQRDAAVRQIADAVAAEREQIMRIATTRIASERDATIEQLNASVESQRQGLTRDMEAAAARTIHRLFIYASAVVALAVGLGTFAILALRRGRERRRESERRSPLVGLAIDK